MKPDVNEIFGKFTAWRYDSTTWFITALGGSLYMYLLEGEHHALLIDTAYGCGDLRGFVEGLTDKPVWVANTHGHLDHVGGNGLWQKAFMHKNAPVDMATLAGGPCDVSKLPYPDYERVYLAEGDSLDLGGRVVEVLDISAHSHGSLAFLDESHRLAFTGDELEAGQVLMFEMEKIEDAPPYDFRARVTNHRANMQKLLANAHRFDFLCPGHNGAPIDKGYIGEFIALDEDILAGSVQTEDELHHEHIGNMPVAPQLCRARHGRASFFVRKADLK